jgi:bacterioferritin-associated ferredoxin
LLVGDKADLAPARRAFESIGVRPVRSVPTIVLRRILGGRRVSGAVVDAGGRDERLSTDLIVFADRTPNLDLVLAAGAAVTTRDGVVVPVLDERGRSSVPHLRVVGSASGARAPAAAHRNIHPRTLVCFCEDVHADEIAAQVRSGYGDPELVKRRTGALTGPCQGKYCLQAFTGALAAAGVEATELPTARPPLRPVRLGDLVPADET